MRAKPLCLLGIALAGALGVLAGSQTWVVFTLDGAAAAEAVAGHTINPALSPVSIALVAAALALTIAGPVFRRVLGVLVALLGAGLVALVGGVLAAPVPSVSARITEITGITGGDETALVESSSVTAWPAAAIAAGVLAVLLGATVLAFGGRWGAAGRKYEAESAGSAPVADRGGAPDRISDWDALSNDDDPTASDP